MNNMNNKLKYIPIIGLLFLQNIEWIDIPLWFFYHFVIGIPSTIVVCFFYYQILYGI